MNIRHYILLVLLMFACCGKIAANDEYKFASFMTTDGLSDNTVLCGLCDRYGFMWLGTSNGLNCFDGRRNVVYRNFPTMEWGCIAAMSFCRFWRTATIYGLDVMTA